MLRELNDLIFEYIWIVVILLCAQSVISMIMVNLQNPISLVDLRHLHLEIGACS